MASSGKSPAVGSAQITDGSIVNADLADMAAARIKGRATGAGTGVPVDLTGAQVAAVVVPTPAAITQTYATADATLAAQTAATVPTDAATNVVPFGYTQAQADAIVTNLNALRADHLDLAQVLNSVVDALQAVGLLA